MIADRLWAGFRPQQRKWIGEDLLASFQVFAASKELESVLTNCSLSGVLEGAAVDIGGRVVEG